MTRGGVKWLPTDACSGRIVTDVVIDFLAAKRRLRPKERVFEAPPIQKTIALAEEFRRLLDAGSVNQSALARLHGLTRARVTQVLNVLKLHPAILAALRALTPGPHARLYTERRVRRLEGLPPDEQLRKVEGVFPALTVAIRPAYQVYVGGRSLGVVPQQAQAACPP